MRKRSGFAGTIMSVSTVGFVATHVQVVVSLSDEYKAAEGEDRRRQNSASPQKRDF